MAPLQDLAREIGGRPAAPRVRFSICTMVTKEDEYRQMVAAFKAGGFDGDDCEFLHADNRVGNRYDAHAAYNLFLLTAAGAYLILCHQDIVLLSDGRPRLDRVIAELDALDPAWGLFGNAGGVRLGTLAVRISDPNFDNASRNGPFPVRCHSLDENFIVVRRDANLALPRDRSGFHLYGTELCLIADILGWNAYVVDFHLCHFGKGRIDGSFLIQLNQVVDKYRAAFRPRWITTPCTDLFLSNSRLLNVLANRRWPFRLMKWFLGTRRPR